MTAGMALKWFKDEFCAAEQEQSRRERRSVYEILDEIADSAPALSNGLILLPYLTGVIQPDNNPAAKGVFFGVGLETKKPHFVRAIFESIAFMLRENLELLESITGEPMEEIRCLGGGSKSDVWLRIKADVTGKRMLPMTQSECTSLGAAILGGTAAGMFGDIGEAAGASNRARAVIEPDKSAYEMYGAGFATYREVYSRLRTLF
jgi:xylulokinase